MSGGGGRGWGWLAAFLLGMLVAGPLGMYLEGGARLLYAVTSPDGRLRADFYGARRWQALRHPFAVDASPGFVRITRPAGDEILGESPAFELADAGQVIWDARTVTIGTSAQFDIARRHWTLF